MGKIADAPENNNFIFSYQDKHKEELKLRTLDKIKRRDRLENQFKKRLVLEAENYASNDKDYIDPFLTQKEKMARIEAKQKLSGRKIIEMQTKE